MKLRTLERELERLETIEYPDLHLEQYRTPPLVAARLLFHAAMRGDITGKSVWDLGCGAGILACGAALLGAETVTGVDIDTHSIEVARGNATRVGRELVFYVADITDDAAFAGAFADTVVMNPPFGVQQRYADRPFIDRALALGKNVYGVFNAGSRDFVTSYTAGRATVEEAIRCRFPMRRTFAFHTKEWKEIEVEILCLKRLP
ncbi:MAG: METTL5 family protein [Methanomicrobiales archaeon]|nr:METTL5 family protein [Methanomicrobiales archaeon]